MVDLVVLTRSDQLLFLLPEVNSTEPLPFGAGVFCRVRLFRGSFPRLPLSSAPSVRALWIEPELRIEQGILT
jgi:hypothetical protein